MNENEPPEIDLSRHLFTDDEAQAFEKIVQSGGRLPELNAMADRALKHINWFLSGLSASGNLPAVVSLSIAMDILRRHTGIHAGIALAQQVATEEMQAFREGMSVAISLAQGRLKHIQSRYGELKPIVNDDGVIQAIACDGNTFAHSTDRVQ